MSESDSGNPNPVPFSFEGTEVRALTAEDGEPLFVASDVAKALGYREAHKLTRIVDDDEKGTQNVGTPSGVQEMAVLTEGGVYEATFNSRRPEAKAFKRWVKHEVLPAIRRTGSYANPAQIDMKAVGGMVKGIVQKAIEDIRHELKADAVEMEMVRDPRRGVGEYVTSFEVCVREGAPQRKRRQLSQKVSNRLTAYSIQHGYPLRASQETGRRMFHRDAVDGWLREQGRALIREHIDSVTGQGRLVALDGGKGRKTRETADT